MVVRQIYEWARTRPDKTALVRGEARLDYAAFARAIDAMRRFLASQAPPAGRTAMVLAEDLRDAWFIVLALQSLGLDTIAVRSLGQAAGLALKDIACVVVAQADQASQGVGHYSWPGARVTVVPPTLYDGIHVGDLPSVTELRQPQGGHILLSSGTTGTYKKILRDGANADKVAAKLARVRDFHADMAYDGSNFGLWTATGYAQPRAVWHVGGCVIFDQQPEYLANLFRRRVTHTTLLPPDIKKILASRSSSEPRFDGLTIHCGGGFLPLAAAEGAISRIAGKLLLVYGASECVMLMEQSFAAKEDLFWLTPSDGRVAQIVDEAGREVPTGSQGVLRFRLIDTDSRSYVDNEEASARAFRDGYFYPGDLAIRRADGRIRVVGRAADVLNLHGQKIASAPIELSIQERLGVDEVCLFTTLSDEGKEELVIALQSAHQPPQAALAALAGEFASFDRVRFAVLEEFPRTAAGLKKVDRVALRLRLLGQDC